MNPYDHVRRLTAVSLLAAVGMSLFVLEYYIPFPLPFMKLGLANVSSLLALYLFGWSAMMQVITLRVIAGSLFVGMLFGPGFLLSIAAAIASGCVMGIVKKVRTLSIIGVSVLGAISHVVTQLVVARYLLIHHDAVFSVLPLLLLIGLVSGLVTGWIALNIVAFLGRTGMHVITASSGSKP